MGKYDNVTMKEYMKRKKEMLDDLGRIRNHCEGIECANCPLLFDGIASCHELEMTHTDFVLERVMEYEPKVDWSKVEVDTKVLVSDNKEQWYKGYFAKYDGEYIYIYIDGRTSFTAKDISRNAIAYRYAKLYKGDK